MADDFLDVTQPLHSAQKKLLIKDNGDGTFSISVAFPSAQSISGTVTANLSATDNAVLDDIAANQTDGSQVVQLGTTDNAVLDAIEDNTSPVTAVTVYNTTLTSANTEYSQALPANTRGMRFRCRTLYDVRYAFVTGKVATPTAPYLTLPAGCDYFANELNLTSITVYWASATAGVVVECEAWS